jgi:hypothetical protein
LTRNAQKRKETNYGEKFPGKLGFFWGFSRETAQEKRPQKKLQKVHAEKFVQKLDKKFHVRFSTAFVLCFIAVIAFAGVSQRRWLKNTTAYILQKIALEGFTKNRPDDPKRTGGGMAFFCLLYFVTSGGVF